MLATGSYTRAPPGSPCRGRSRPASRRSAWSRCRTGWSCSAVVVSAWSSPPSSVPSHSEVTVVEALPRLVAAEDEAVSKLGERRLPARFEARRGACFEGATQSADTGTRHAPRASLAIEADLLPVAVGRGPRPRRRPASPRRGLTIDRGFGEVGPRSPFLAGGPCRGASSRPALARRGFAQGTVRGRGHRGARDPTPIDESGIPPVTLQQPRDRLGGSDRDPGTGEARGRSPTYEYNLGGNRQVTDPRHGRFRQAGAATKAPSWGCAWSFRTG